MINTPSESLKARKVFIFQHFRFYKHLKFHAQLSWTRKKVYNLGARWRMCIHWHIMYLFHFNKCAATCDFQQCGILTSVHSDEPVQLPFKLRNLTWCSVSSLTVIKYSSDRTRFWPVCAYAQAGLSLCWLHIPHCWKSHAKAQMSFKEIIDEKSSGSDQDKRHSQITDQPRAREKETHNTGTIITPDRRLS